MDEVEFVDPTDVPDVRSEIWIKVERDLGSQSETENVARDTKECQVNKQNRCHVYYNQACWSARQTRSEGGADMIDSPSREHREKGAPRDRTLRDRRR